MALIKATPVSIATQAGLLQKAFPYGKVLFMHPALEWECGLQPTVLSITYKVKLIYRLGFQPEVFVIYPHLQVNKKNKLPHVFSVTQQHLCLHYPPERKWHGRLAIAHTIVPWAAEWLFHYEIWQVTDQWNGGGIEHSGSQPAKPGLLL